MKDFILRQIGKRYKNVEWAKRNKTWIGFGFFVVTGFVQFGCPGLDGSICAKLTLAVTNIGSFLVGAGLLPSDFRERVVQGKVNMVELKADEAAKKEEN
jgi:hypothetical protein